VIRIGQEERDAIFRPLWRLAFTAVLVALPFVLIPVTIQAPDRLATWIGPLSIVPLAWWFYRGVVRARKARESKATKAGS
jgi:hypothetical protein